VNIDERRVKQLAEQGVSEREIAQRMGVSRTPIRKILGRLTKADYQTAKIAEMLTKWPRKSVQHENT
jgi:transposase